MSELKERFRAKAKEQARTDVVHAPGIGDVTIRGLTGLEYDQYEAACAVVEGKNMKHVSNRALLVKMGVVDEDGKNLFSDADMDFLKGLGADVTVPLASAIMKLSGVTQDEQEATEKN